MGRLEITFSTEAARQYGKLPQEYKRLVDAALLRLSQGAGLDLKPVKGRRDVYRIRVGRYRVLLRKFDTDVLVFRISPRGGAYK